MQPRFESVAELEDELSRPDDGVVHEIAKLDGDLVVLGAGGKMGPTLARMAQRALGTARKRHAVVAVSRFSDPRAAAALEEHGVRVHAADLTDRAAVAALPDAAAVIFLAGTKFGTGDRPASTWAQNAWLPGLCAERYRGVPSVVLSSGNVYPFVAASGTGASETTPPAPVGEYAWSVLARERMYEHFSELHGTRVVIVRLNYATELRYGVLVDIAQRVAAGAPIDLTMGHVNVIWQRDANACVLRALRLGAAPPRLLNLTGPEVLSVRELAEQLGGLLGREPVLRGTEQANALLSDAGQATSLFGPPGAGVDRMLAWVAAWVAAGLPTHDKPTHFEEREGSF